MNASILTRFLLCALTAMVLFPLCRAAAPPPILPAEEGLPIHAVRRLGSGRLRQMEHPTSLDWSPDGKWIATGSWSGPARIWDATTGLFQPRLVEQSH